MGRNKLGVILSVMIFIIGIALGALLMSGVLNPSISVFNYEHGSIATEAPSGLLDKSEEGLPAASIKHINKEAKDAIFFTVLHETGHMFIKELDLPAIGPEEDVADEFAGFVLTEAIKNARTPEEKHDYRMVVVDGLNFWYLSAQFHGQPKTAAVWSDEHSPDLRRLYNIYCVATGADPGFFAPLGAKLGVPDDRVTRCADEYQRKLGSWQKLLAEHRKSFIDRVLNRGGKLKLSIEPNGSAEYQAIENMYLSNAIQPLLDVVSDNLALPENVKVVAKKCGTVNAYWSPSDKAIYMCHEMASYTVSLFVLAELSHLDQQAKAPRPSRGNETANKTDSDTQQKAPKDTTAPSAASNGAAPAPTSTAANQPPQKHGGFLIFAYRKLALKRKISDLQYREMVLSMQIKLMEEKIADARTTFSAYNSSLHNADTVEKAHQAEETYVAQLNQKIAGMRQEVEQIDAELRQLNAQLKEVEKQDEEQAKSAPPKFGQGE